MMSDESVHDLLRQHADRLVKEKLVLEQKVSKLEVDNSILKKAFDSLFAFASELVQAQKRGR